MKKIEITQKELDRLIGEERKKAWFMLQRIRYAIENHTYEKKLGNKAEIDETYVGGNRRGSKRGRGAEHKTSVIGIVEREGEVRAQATTDTTSRTVEKIVRKYVQIGTTFYSDEYPVYNCLDRQGFNHKACNHSAKKYVIGDIHTNTIEGFWSHLKRGVDGVYHHVSKKHMNKYVKEYEYRYNTRLMTDFQRFNDWFNFATVNITYRRLING